MRRRGPAEEVDEEPALTGVLIGQKRERAIVLQDLDHLVEAARLGDELLAGPLAKRSEKPLEIGVVERACDRDRGKPEHAEDIAGHLPVAVMAGQEDERAFAAHEEVEKGPVPFEHEPITPVGQVELPREMKDLDEHRSRNGDKRL